MCQICTITTLSTSNYLRPRPARCLGKQQKSLTSTSTSSTSATTTTNTNAQTKPLLSLLRTLSASLTSLEHERAAWWKSKTPLIKALKDEVSGQSEKRLTELHKINNSAIERLEGMEAKLGGFVRWTMGVKGGVEELCKGGDGEQ
jgi:hypothetical protein